MRLLSVLPAFLMALAAPRPAAAEQHLVFPEVGLAVGRAALPESPRAIALASLQLGSEWDQGRDWAAGWLFNLSYVDSNEHGIPFPWRRVQLAPMASVGLGVGTYHPFGRVALGPQLTMAWRETSRAMDFGGGLGAELSAGFKDLVEVFVHADVGLDAKGLSVLGAGGVRVNFYVLLWFAQLFSGHSHSSPPDVHRAAPAPPR